MKEMKTYIIALKFVCLTGIMSLPLKGYSQDSHFSQIYEIPILLNPARTGFFKDNYRLAGIYRSQWKEITQPFKTISGTIDLNIPAGKNRTNLVGIGLMNFADKAGDADYTSNYLEAAFSFHKNFGDNFSHYLGMGMMTGFATTSFDITKLTFDEDFGTGINSDIPDITSTNFFDMSAGIEYNFLNEKMHFNAGFSVFHLNEPGISYFGNDASRINRKWVISTGLAKSISPMAELLPRAAFFIQGPSSEFEFGTDVKIVLSKNSNTNYAIFLGAYLRLGDAFIPKFKIDMGDLSFGLSYDIPVSGLSEISRLAGGPELSIAFLGTVKGISAGRVYNPRF